MELTAQEMNFWVAYVTAASALAGFTLASYGIFVSRIGIASADSVCRRYLFKECTSQYSLAFILFALALFVTPLAHGLATLVQRKADRSAILTLEVLFLISLVAFVVKQVQYAWYLRRYASKLENATERIDRETIAFARKLFRHVLAWLHFLFGMMLIFTAIAAVAANVLYMNERLIDNSQQISSLIGRCSAEGAAIVALLLGVTLVSWNFYLFAPSRLVFVVDSETKRLLADTRDNIEKSVKKFEPMRAWLTGRLRAATARLRDLDLGADDLRSAEQVLQRVAESLNSDTKSPIDGSELTLEKLQSRHDDWLRFLSNDVSMMRFREIVSIMSGIERYIEAVSRHEQRLKEIPDQLTVLWFAFGLSKSAPRGCFGRLARRNS